jgi:DNA-directed RNA polymerase specialized sigma24 family protein
MSEPASVSQWIVDVRAGGQEAAQRLYNRYLRRLAENVRKKMNGASRRMSDEEDIAHAALTSLFMQIRRGSFPQMANRCDLWQVLIMLANRRLADLKRQQFSLKRGAGCEVGESALGECGDASGDCRAIEQVIGHEPPPEMVVELEDVCRRLLDQLDDPLLKRMAALKLEGYDQAEIAQRVGCARRSVQRKLRLIRKVWMAGR